MIVNDCLEDVKKKVGGVHQMKVTKVGGVHLMKVTTFDASLYLHIYIVYAVLRYSLGVFPVCALKKRTKC